jgi:hypothetical protein
MRISVSCGFVAELSQGDGDAEGIAWYRRTDRWSQQGF